jgi:hypothetical protein
VGSTRTRRFLCGLVFLLLGAIAPLTGPPTLSSQTDADWEWMGKNFGPTMELLLPIKKTLGGYVSYRSYRDLYTDVLEYSFLIGHDQRKEGYGAEPHLSAHVRMADSISIYDQMMKMHRANPQKDLVDIQHAVKLKMWDLTEKTCPVVQSQFQKFQKLRFGPPVFDEIVLHPLIHEFRIQAGMGGMDLSLVDSEHPLVIWALETRRALESCVSSPLHSKPAN